MLGLTNDQPNLLRHRAEGDRYVMRATTDAHSSEPSGTGYRRKAHQPPGLADNCHGCWSI